VARKRQNFTPEFKAEAVKLVLDSGRPVAQIAREINVHEGTLGNWVNAHRAAHPVEEAPLTVSERARLHELEREVRELRMKAEFLGKAAAFFAQEYR
jgi:transposase-like protein